MRNFGKQKRSVILLFGIMVFCLLFLPEKKAEAAEPTLYFLTAEYEGESVYVGEYLDLEKLTVKGYYSDGRYEEVYHYSLSSYRVDKEGYNSITVYCEGEETSFYVLGRRVTYLSAYYADNSVTIGDSLRLDKVIVYASFSDGTTEEVKDFTLPDMAVKKLGRNEFYVIYKDQVATFYVTGKEERKMTSIYASYNGPAVIEGNKPDPTDFYVVGFFNDDTVELIKEFDLKPEVVEEVGTNILELSYGEFSVDVRVQGRAKRVESLTAEYTGLPVVVGKSVAVEDLKVIATFNDESRDEVKNFTLSSSIIEKVGDNILTVFCDGVFTRVTVRGIEFEEIDYDHGVEKTIRDGGLRSTVCIAVGKKADPDLVQIDKVAKNYVEKAMHRLIKTDKYIAYEVSFDDPDMDTFLPMTMKVTVPSGFDEENFAVFYTPNRKTIMAQMNGEFLDDGFYEFKMFQPGTYIIADCTPLLYVESVSLDEGEELTMRLGRSYSLDPLVLPHVATNKEVEYTSSRPEVVSVDKYGTLTANKVGMSVITVTAKDGSGKKCTLRVSVTK